MAKILLNWTWDADLIECPNYITKNLNKYQRKFDKCISNPKNKHGYWGKDCEGGIALCFNGEAFLNWLNEVVISASEEKAYFLKREYHPTKEEEKLPKINF